MPINRARTKTQSTKTVQIQKIKALNKKKMVGKTVWRSNRAKTLNPEKT
jgi:hypothetical protein